MISNSFVAAAFGAFVWHSVSTVAAPPQEYEVVLVLEEEPPATPSHCMLSVCCWTVLLPGLGPIAHCYTLCGSPDPEAVRQGCRGGPAGFFNNERSSALTYAGCPVSADPTVPAEPARGDPCANASGTGIWGAIAAGCGRFEGKHPDKDRWFADCNHFEVDCETCACIERTMAHINCCCFRYEPLLLFDGHNSNSVIFSALQRCTSLVNESPMPLLFNPIGWEPLGNDANCPCHQTTPLLPASGCD